MTGAPMLFQWDGDVMRPRSPREADRRYVVGEIYRMEVREERSMSSHGHQFAWLTEAWKQLPEKMADLYPSPEHLRKRALIEAGYYREEIIDAGSNAGALRVAAYVRGREEFALVIVRGAVVVIRQAKSQSYRSMDRKEFAASKQAVMEIVAGLIGVPVDELKQEAGRAA